MQLTPISVQKGYISDISQVKVNVQLTPISQQTGYISDISHVKVNVSLTPIPTPIPINGILQCGKVFTTILLHKILHNTLNDGVQYDQ